MRRIDRTASGESGQVLLLGLIMMVIVLLAILLIFDVHNVIRAKFKTETAHQAAALAGARWQKESLNLIGDINLIKACETMMESEVGPWRDAGNYDNDETPEEQYQSMLRARLGILTEMQTRITFVGPLIGFAAAQQAAKANGLSGRDSLSGYVRLLEESWRYRQEYGGASDVINGFRWRLPYTEMVRAIVQRGVAVFPNARLANNPAVEPPQLAYDSLYEEIRRHDSEISAGDPPAQTTWMGKIYPFVKTWRDSDFAGKWWNIDYAMTKFPNESEIYTIGVAYGSGDYDTSYDTVRQLLQPYQSYESTALPFGVRFCLYDNFWYPEYYRQNYKDYDQNHYEWWFEGGTLRSNVKDKYIYEGPAAYAEGAVEVDSVSRFGLRGGSRSAALDRRLYNRGTTRTRIGTRRTASASADGTLTDYRPGAIAKVLGELSNNRPPIAVPIILPVFDNTTLTPTYMPMPYGFGVLRIGNTPLDRFLNWLGHQQSLFLYPDPPPSGTGEYLYALQRLTDGKGFRYYGFNPVFDAKAFDLRYYKSAGVLFTDRGYVYSQANSRGAGWLQEAQIFYLTDPNDSHQQAVTDHVNGGTAMRFFNPADANSYIVVDSKNHIITNDEIDPTRLYITGGGGGGAPGYGGTQDKPDNTPGPPRL